MFDYLEPSDHDESEAAQGTGSLPLPPRSGANDQGNRPLTPERVRHLLYGSRAGLERTIKILHALGYADPNDWSDPLPVPTAAAPSLAPPSSGGVETWMVILTRTVLLE